MIYLDNAATTKVDDRVIEKVVPFFSHEYGNPGGKYKLGRKAKDAVENARRQVAKMLGCDADKIIFTSGGSEGNSMMMTAISQALYDFGLKHIIASSVEHHSIMNALEELKSRGFSYTLVDPDSSGVVRLADIKAAVRPETGMVCVMAVNNETGAINEYKEIGHYCDEEGFFYMMDCVQAAGTIRIDVNEILCDFATISSHKIHGPKGVGAMYFRGDKTWLKPIVFGGSEQEFGVRGGTENVPGIVGFGYACELADGLMLSTKQYLSSLKLLFYSELSEALKVRGLGGILHVNGDMYQSTGKVINVRLDGVDAETLLMMLDANDVCVSAGSACNSMEHEPSHVLKAMGLTDEEARSSIRVSFSTMNTVLDATRAASVIAECARSLKVM